MPAIIKINNMNARDSYYLINVTVTNQELRLAIAIFLRKLSL